MLKVENISKQFSGVTVLDRVSMDLHAGKVNAIIGENGAGKSTLMKILSGVHTDYEGQLLLNETSISFSTPKEAQEKGISIIHQELNLIPYLSITENIFLGREIVNSWGMLDMKEMSLKTQQVLDRLKLGVNPDSKIYELKVGQQQVVEIAKALLLDSEVIIMDEPTSAISDHEVEVLFELVKDLRRENKVIIYISHKLDELFSIADYYHVLRDGCFIESGEMKDINREHLIHKMVGREILVDRKTMKELNTEEVLSIQNLYLQHPIKKKEHILHNISFTVHKGEVVGLFGLMGAGRTELFETIFGLNPDSYSGEIHVNQKQLTCNSPIDAISSGVALVPEDRKKDGLITGMNVQDNIGITVLKKLESLGFLNTKKETDLAEKYIDELQIKVVSSKQLAGFLSGGNQQKIVLAKWLATNPSILLLDEPTRGIDVNAKNEIYKLIASLADSGLAILIVSSELPEILAVSDRIFVMAEGRLAAEFSNTEASQENILQAAIPNTE